jgi:integrase/recombinase XerD
MLYQSFVQSFEMFLRLEKGLSEASTSAYLSDLKRWAQYQAQQESPPSLSQIQAQDLEQYLQTLANWGLAASSQARVLSSLKNFFLFLAQEQVRTDNPTQLLSMPKLPAHLPEVLSLAELDSLFSAIDHSTREGQRNRAMLEVLYACGLRVSELIQLRLSHLYLNAGFIRVLGKGNKERIVPIGDSAIKHLEFYLMDRRQQNNVQAKHQDIVFLNRRGAALSRVMVFMIVKELAEKAGIQKNISPHTFRHTFATHLIEGGADLKIIQDLLGHESITTTEIYTHLDINYLRETIAMYHPRN